VLEGFVGEDSEVLGAGWEDLPLIKARAAALGVFGFTSFHSASDIPAGF